MKPREIDIVQQCVKGLSPRQPDSGDQPLMSIPLFDFTIYKFIKFINLEEKQILSDLLSNSK